MLTEGDKLEEWAINLINDYEASGKYSSSEPKRIGRFSGEIAANPEAYYELFDMARSKNLTGKQLVQAVRSIEDILLGNKNSIRNPVIKELIDSMSWNPADRRKLMSDVIHHLYAQRTGGDTLRRLSQAERKIGRNILRAEGYSWGNIDKNLLSLFRAWHTKQERLTGVEKIAAEIQGYTGTSAGLGTEKIHDRSPSSKDITGTITGATTGIEAAFGVGEDTGMLEQFKKQEAATKATMKQVQPIFNKLDKLVSKNLPKGKIIRYSPDLSQENLNLYKTILENNLEDVQRIVNEALSPFIPNKGSISLRAMDPISMAAGGSLNALKDIVADPKGAGIGALLDVLTSPEIAWQLGKGNLPEAGKVLAGETVKGAVVGGALQAVAPKLMANPITATAGVALGLKGAIDAKVAYDAAQKGFESPKAYLEENRERDQQAYVAAMGSKQDLPPGSVPKGFGIAYKNGKATIVPWGSVAGEQKVGPKIVGKPWWTLWQ